MCMDILLAGISVHHVHEMLTEARRYQISWNRSYRELLVTRQVLRIKAGSSERAVSVLNNWIISQALKIKFSKWANVIKVFID